MSLLSKDPFPPNLSLEEVGMPWLSLLLSSSLSLLSELIVREVMQIMIWYCNNLCPHDLIIVSSDTCLNTLTANLFVICVSFLFELSNLFCFWKKISVPTIHELSYLSCKLQCKKWENIQTFIQRLFFDPQMNFLSQELPLYTSVIILIRTNKISCCKKVVVSERQSYFPKTKINCCNLDYTPFLETFYCIIFFPNNNLLYQFNFFAINLHQYCLRT